MAAKPLTRNAIALAEKKMNMTLADDIIKMSKRSDFKVKKQRVPNKSQKFLNGGSNKGNALKVRRFMDSRSSLRQGFLGQRRSNFQGNQLPENQFPLATEVAKKAAATPIHARVIGRNRMVYWNKPRIGAPPVQRRVLGGGFPGKKQAKVVAKQRPQTLDSLFANMKEQRMRHCLNKGIHNVLVDSSNSSVVGGDLATIPSN